MTFHTVRYTVSILHLSILCLFAAALMLPSASAQTPATRASPGTNRPSVPAAQHVSSPGLPAFAHGSIDQATYLRLRAAHIARLRGLDTIKDPKARSKAILQMRRQEIERDDHVSAAARDTAFTSSASALIPAAFTVPPWQSIGPAPIPHDGIGGTGVPISGRVTAIAVHPTNPNIVYIGTMEGGVWRSLDGGVTWIPLMDNAQSLAVGAVAIAPSQPSTIFVGTGEGDPVNGFFGVGVYRIDGADTTNPTLVGPLSSDGASDVFTGRSITQILVDPADASTIFVSSTDGISGVSGDRYNVQPPRGLYRSTNAMANAGVTFTKLAIASANSGDRAITGMAFEPGNPNNLIVNVSGIAVAGDGGIYRSTNALATTPTFTQTLLLLEDFLNVKFAANKVGSAVTLLAATAEYTGNVVGKLRKSTDGGATWSAPLPAADGFCVICPFSMAVAIDPADANHIYLGGQRRYNTPGVEFTRSTDGGATFSPSQGNLYADTHAIAIAPSISSIIYLGDEGGIFKSSDNGTTWASLNTAGLSITPFLSLALHPSDRQFMIGGAYTTGTQLLLPDGTWFHTNSGEGSSSAIDNNATDTIKVTMYNGNFNLTNQLIGFVRVTSVANALAGLWTDFGCGQTNPNGINCGDSVLLFPPMAVGPASPNTLYFGTDRLYRSVDQGANMTIVSQQPFIPTQQVSAIGISPINDSVRIVGLTNGRLFATTTGANPLTDVTGRSLPQNYVARAVIDPNNSSTAYVTFDGYGLAPGAHVWKTTNLNLSDTAGTTWALSGNGIPDVPVNAFVVDPLDPNLVYAGTDIGVYASRDAGAFWNPYGSGLPRVAVFDMAIQNSNRILRVATHGRGIWEVAPIKVPTIMSVVANPSSLVSGQTLVLTANVASEAGAVGPVPTGAVRFLVFNSNVTFVDTTVTMSGGSASANLLLNAGVYQFLAVYSGDNTFAGSGTAATSLNVGQASTMVTVSSSNNPVPAGSPVTFTAQVTPLVPGSGTASGTATFFDGATNLGSANLLNNASASLSTPTLTIGSHSITASYSGDMNFTGSTSQPITQTITTSNFTVQLTQVSPPPNQPALIGGSFGRIVAFRADVTNTGTTTTSSNTITTTTIENSPFATVADTGTVCQLVPISQPIKTAITCSVGMMTTGQIFTFTFTALPLLSHDFTVKTIINPEGDFAVSHVRVRFRPFRF